jgi:hypothetical protein
MKPQGVSGCLCWCTHAVCRAVEPPS